MLVAVLLGALSTTATASAQRYVTDCTKAKVKPTTITLACGDANEALTSLSWLSWGKATAIGAGKYAYNDCKPTCVAGHNHRVKVSVHLKGSITCHGRNHYKTAEVTFTGTVPPGMKKTTNHRLGCPKG
jgi:hypothetical protein